MPASIECEAGAVRGAGVVSGAALACALALFVGVAGGAGGGAELPGLFGGGRSENAAGVPAGSAASRAAGLPATDTIAPASGAAPGVQQVPAPRPVHVVMMVSEGLEPDASATEEKVRRVVSQASGWWESQSAGRVRFEVADVQPWRSTEVGCTDVDALWAQAHEWAPQSMEAGHHLLVVLPETAVDQGCEYGYGSMGVLDSGGSVMVTSLVPSLVAHELGHNLGLGHSHALICEGAADGRWNARAEQWEQGCAEESYDDLLDVMGYSGPGFGETALNAVHLDALGAEPSAVQVVPAAAAGASTSVTVRVPPMGSGEPGRAVKVVEPGGPTYYVEYRTAVGLDANFAASGWKPELGVRILRTDQRFRDASGSFELDATPDDRSDYSRALPVGGRFESADAGVQVETLATDADAATIQVTVGAPAR